MKQRTRTLLLIFALAGICAACPARADELILNSGERLIGTLKSMEDGTVIFISAMLGKLKIPISNVKHLSVDTPLETHLASGEIIPVSRLDFKDETGTIELHEDPVPLIVGITEIKAFNPPAKPAITFTGNITAGVVDTRGSSSSTKANLDSSLTIRTQRQRLSMDARYFYGREKNDNRKAPGTRKYTETDKEFRAGAKYDFFFTEKIYSFLSTSYKRDPIADLKYRWINSGGLGYQWIETPRLKFSTDGGIAHYQEKYSSRTLNPLYGQEGHDNAPKYLRDITRVDDWAWQAGLNLDWRINRRLISLGQARYTQSFDDSDDYYLMAEGEIRMFLTGSFYSNFKAILEYDNTPGSGSRSTETKYIMGLGWSF